MVGVEKREGVRRELGEATETGKRGEEREVVIQEVSGRKADLTSGLDSESVGLIRLSSPQFNNNWFMSDFMFSAPPEVLALVFRNLWDAANISSSSSFLFLFFTILSHIFTRVSKVGSSSVTTEVSLNLKSRRHPSTISLASSTEALP